MKQKLIRKKYGKEPRAKVANWLVVAIQGGKKSYDYFMNRDEVRVALKLLTKCKGTVIQVFRLHDEFVEGWETVNATSK
jgi:hypothetical protein